MGCVIAEVWLGTPLFVYTRTSVARLAALEQVLGAIPATLIEGSPLKDHVSLVENADSTYHVKPFRRDVYDAVELSKIRRMKPLRVGTHLVDRSSDLIYILAGHHPRPGYVTHLPALFKSRPRSTSQCIPLKVVLLCTICMGRRDTDTGRRLTACGSAEQPRTVH